MELSKMFGVERGEKFRVDGYCGEFMVKSQGNFERLYRVLAEGDFDKERNVNVLSDIINGAPDNIIHLPPPLTDEQRAQLKAIWTLGGRWLAKDETGDVFAYDSKPQKIMIYCRWNNDEDGEYFTVMRELSVCEIVSWNDDEPFDISKALGGGGMSKPENIPGNDSIRPGRRMGTVCVVGHSSKSQIKCFTVRRPGMSDNEAIEILENIETGIYGKIAIAKAIDALRERKNEQGRN